MSLTPADTANQIFIIATFQKFVQNTQSNFTETATYSPFTSFLLTASLSILHDVLKANYLIL